MLASPPMPRQAARPLFSPCVFFNTPLFAICDSALEFGSADPFSWGWGGRGLGELCHYITDYITDFFAHINILMGRAGQGLPLVYMAQVMFVSVLLV